MLRGQEVDPIRDGKAKSAGSMPFQVMTPRLGNLPHPSPNRPPRPHGNGNISLLRSAFNHLTDNRFNGPVPQTPARGWSPATTRPHLLFPLAFRNDSAFI